MATAPNLHYIDAPRDGQDTDYQHTTDSAATAGNRRRDASQTAGNRRWLKQLSIKARLTLLICLLCALISGVGALGIYGMSSSNRAMLSVYEDRVIPLADMVTIIDSLNRIRIHAIEAANTSSQAVVTDAIAGTRELDIEIDNSWSRILATHLTPEVEALTRQFQEALLVYRESREQTLGLASDGDFAASRANAVNDAGPKYRVAHAALEELVEIETTIAAEQHRNGEAMFKVERNITVAAILIALVLGAAMGLLLVRAITKPLTRMTAYLGEIAQGNLTNAIDIHARDEIGLALESLASTQATQRDLVDDIKQAVESINSASVQIAAGNADLSQRTEEQAASLEETAASMEQVSATIKNNSDNTAQANQIAKEASQGAEIGGEKNRLALGKMQELAASSDQITGIISVINNIAFQTNILALNASVEAARAGDQGRGFAVVASEVRNLAQRSAEAAKEIQQLINLNSDIVRDSNNFVGEAGQAMEEILTRIRQVTALMAEITRASEEQALSIEQVRVAVTEMDQVTQQNAALVEESAAAAGSLDDQARSLSSSVSVFRT